MKKLLIVLFGSYLMVACTAMTMVGSGVAHLVLAPFQIALGVLEGITSLPFYLNNSIHSINEGLTQAQAKITLGDTYQSAYNKRINDVPSNGDTGVVFRRMKEATQFFQTVLKQYGVHDFDRYILASVDTANDAGYTLYSVIYRPTSTIQVIDKYDAKNRRTFSTEDRLFYDPFKQDAHNNALDVVIDWAGLSRDSTQTQKGQAVLITIAANSVLSGKRSSDYWEVEKRWIANDYRKITEQRMTYMKNRMGL